MTRMILAVLAGLLVAGGLFVAGAAAFGLALGVATLFASPGLVVLTRGERRDVPLAAASVVVGWTASILGLVAAGAVTGSLSLLLVLGVPLVLTIAARVAVRRRSESGSTAQGGAIRDLAGALICSVFLVAMIAIPLARVGEPRSGHRQYTAFFNADFFKHMAHVQTLAWRSVPPTDAFASGETLHYYWLAYLPSASVLSLGGGSVGAQEILAANAVIQGAMFATLLFAACRVLSGRTRAAAGAAAIALASLSLDGLTSLIRNRPRSPLAVMASENMEPHDLTTLFGATRHLSGSTLYRLSLYLPQHQMALMMFVAWAILFTRNASGPWRRLRLLLVLPLPAVSLPVGGMATIIILIAEMISASRRSERAEAIAVVLWSWILTKLAGVLGDAGVMLLDPFIHAPDDRPSLWIRFALAPPQIVTTIGCTVLFAVGGLLLARGQRRAFVLTASTAGVGVAAMLVGELFDLIRLTVEAQLKASMVLAVGTMFGSALFFSCAREWKPRHTILATAGVVLAALGLVSPIYDVVWHSSTDKDVVSVSEQDMDVLRWVRRNTHPDLVAQQFPEAPFLLGGREMWVPVFAGRQVAISRRSMHSRPHEIEQANALFDPTTEPEVKSALAAQIGVEGLYATRAIQPADYDALIDSFSAAGFTRAYGNRDASFWWVRPGE